MERWLAPLKNALWERIFCAPDEFVGVFPVEDGAVLALVRREDGELFVRLAFERTDAEGLAAGEALATSVELALLRLGWEAPLALCLPEGDVFLQLVDMPEEVTDWREAAYWEADGALVESGLSRENIYWSALRLETGAAVAALERTRAEELKAAFAGHGLELSALFCVTPAVLELGEISGGYEAPGRRLRLEGASLPLEIARPAIFAALTALSEGAPSWPESFLGRAQRRANYGALLSFAALLVLSLSLLLLAFEGASLYAAKVEHEEARAALTELRDAQKEMRLAIKIEEETEAREAALLSLSRRALPLKGDLVRLGALQIDGVQLTGLLLKEGSLELAGEAESYEALGSLTDALAELPGQKLVDVDSKAGEGEEGLSFTLRLEKK